MAVLYGFHALSDVLGQRATTIDQEDLRTAIEQAVAAHNADLNASISLFANHQTTKHQIGVRQMAEGELQDVDEWGRPQPRRLPPPVARYAPIDMAQDSIAANYVTEIKMTVQEVNDRVQSLLLADSKWNRRKLLQALVANTSRTFADQQYGSLSVSTLANGDSELYLSNATGTAAADTHHKGDTALDNDTLTDIRSELIEHDENGGTDAQVVVFIPPTSEAAVKALTGFIAASDPNITQGTGSDAYTGSFAATAPGRPFGYSETAMVHIRTWAGVPANYAIGVTNAGLSPLLYREDEEEALRGFMEWPERRDTPYLQRIWARRRGYAAYNRVGAVVYRTDNATYAVPTIT